MSKSFRFAAIVLAVAMLPLAACDARDAKHRAAGNVHFKQKDYEKARTEFEQAVAANPKDPGNHILLGNALFELGRYDEARRAYEEALRLDPKAGEAHRALAILVAQTARPGDRAAMDEFTAHIEAVIAANPKDKNALSSAAYVLSRYADRTDRDAYLKAQRRAEELLRQVLAMDDRDPTTLFNLALVYARKGDEKTALKVVERLAAVSPRPGFDVYARAVVFALLGDRARALASVEELLKLDLIDPETLRDDPLLASLEGEPRFGELIGAAQERRKGRR